MNNAVQAVVLHVEDWDWGIIMENYEVMGHESRPSNLNHVLQTYVNCSQSVYFE